MSTRPEIREATLVEYSIFVREYGGTYIARCEGKRASCTSSREEAAMAVAVKVANGQDYSVFKINDALFTVKVSLPF